MPFSEDDLRSALKRKDPGPDFTRRVMARVAEQNKRSPNGKPSRSWFAWLGGAPLRLRRAMSAAVAVLVLAVAGWIGYQQHEKNEMAKQLEAAQQTIKALKIANSKLNHVFERVKQSDTNPKVDRRQL